MGSSRNHAVVACPGLSAEDAGRRAREARDQDLVRRVQAGDQAAFEGLLRLYEPHHRRRVRKFINGRSRRRADEPDAMNVAASALWDAALRFDSVQAGREVHCTFSSFEWRVVHAALCNLVRGWKRAEKHLDRSAAAADVLVNGAGGRHGRNPLREILARERRALVARALAELSEQEQVFARLWGCERLSERKLAARLGISLKRVRTRKKRLLALLCNRLAEFKEE